MRYMVDNQHHSDPCVNLALEEYCLKNLDARHPYVLLYVNGPSVIVGRNQNILQEIDGPYVKARRIQVVRRLSGGGAVYHDKGNLNFSFIQNAGTGGLQHIEPLIASVLRSLQHMGVRAHINNRSDLLVGPKKISGCARFSNTRRVMVHGTLLFDADLHTLSRALSPPDNRLLTKAIRSIPHPVANIRPMLNRSMDLYGFTRRLVDLLSNEIGEIKRMPLGAKQWDQVHRLASDKYRTWDWTFGRTPHFSIVKNGRKRDRIQIDVHRGKIAGIAALDPGGDNRAWRILGKQLTGTRYERNEILRALNGFPMPIDNRQLNPEKLATDICVN